ncbi:hypothetical protein [Microbacterium nymphoidis]|uniref:hypothetical protein n=1 Tax=Microbacterium nymphoidis TaxID=2898586 RepID=UPI001E3ED55F|nr:hypothetical protein [Microbacterium nymphoidis]MCD2498498.1 hypothetical protein [Microbacterium nymphoidis]
MRMRNRFGVGSVAVAAAAALVLGAGIAVPAHAETSSSISAATRQTTPEELFEAIYFHSGPLGAQFAEATGLPYTPESADQVKVQREIVAQIVDNDPELLDHIFEAAASRNLPKVRSAVEEGARALSDVLEPMTESPEFEAACLVVPVVAFVFISAWVYVNVDNVPNPAQPAPQAYVARIPDTSAGLSLDRIALEAATVASK